MAWASGMPGLVRRPEVLAGASSRRRKVSVERPLLPRRPSGRPSPPCSVRSSANARRRIWALNAPARPRSPVSGTIATVSTVSRCSSSGRRTEEGAPTPAMSSFIVSAYWPGALIRSSARRSLAAATSSIARVILRVLRTEPIRRLRSWTDATMSRRLACRPQPASAFSSSTANTPTNTLELGLELLLRLVESSPESRIASRIERSVRRCSRARRGTAGPGAPGPCRASRGCRRRSL